MSKAIKFSINATLAALFGLFSAAAWKMADIYMEVPAPVTPVMWLAGTFLGFCCLVYVIETLLTPFRKG